MLRTLSIIFVIVSAVVMMAGCSGGGTTTPTGPEPVANVQIVSPVMPAEGWDCGTRVEFDASASYDPANPNNSNLVFKWDFNNDGTFDGPGDEIDEGSSIRPVKYFAFNPEGMKVRMHVETPSKASIIHTFDFSITFKQSKNIDVGDGAWKAYDIAIDHQTGDVWVLYEQGVIRRWWHSEWYKKNTVYTLGPECDYVDISPNGYMLAVIDNPPNLFTLHYQLPSSLVDSHYFVPVGGEPPEYINNRVMDAVCMFGYGQRANDHMAICGAEQEGNGFYYSYAYRYSDDSSFGTQNIISYFLDPISGVTGAGKLNFMDIVAAEADPSGDYIWMVEGTDLYAHRMDVSSFMLTHDIDFGTGTSGSGDDQMTNPLDITSGEDGHMYILDDLGGGSYTVRAFNNTDGLALTQMALTGLELTPVRFDGSPTQDLLVILQTDSGLGARISVVTANLTP
jgi:hypothetical protein